MADPAAPIRPDPTLDDATASTRWDDFFFRLCDDNARMSKDPSTKVGAVIVRPDRTVLSMGWNSFPRGCDDDPAIYADRPRKLARTVHAEANAVTTAETRPRGCTLYVSPLHPCSVCAGLIIQSGITTVVAGVEADTAPERWAESFAESARLFAEAGVAVRIVRRNRTAP